MDLFIIDEYKSCVTDNFSNVPFEKKQSVSKAILLKYPHRVPVIVNKGKNEKIFITRKSAFLVPLDITLGKFISEVRKHIPSLDPSVAIFFFVGDVLPSVSSSMSYIYDTYKNPDGFLYITYMSENTFG